MGFPSQAGGRPEKSFCAILFTVSVAGSAPTGRFYMHLLQRTTLLQTLTNSTKTFDSTTKKHPSVHPSLFHSAYSITSVLFVLANKANRQSPQSLDYSGGFSFSREHIALNVVTVENRKHQKKKKAVASSSHRLVLMEPWQHFTFFSSTF